MLITCILNYNYIQSFCTFCFVLLIYFCKGFFTRCKHMKIKIKIVENNSRILKTFMYMRARAFIIKIRLKCNMLNLC